ncbi:MAG: hypothetical protein SGARI_002891, partial [Bacillariaceae sp.]
SGNGEVSSIDSLIDNLTSMEGIMDRFGERLDEISRRIHCICNGLQYVKKYHAELEDEDKEGVWALQHKIYTDMLEIIIPETYPGKSGDEPLDGCLLHHLQTQCDEWDTLHGRFVESACAFARMLHLPDENHFRSEAVLQTASDFWIAEHEELRLQMVRRTK